MTLAVLLPLPCLVLRRSSFFIVLACCLSPSPSLSTCRETPVLLPVDVYGPGPTINTTCSFASSTHRQYMCVHVWSVVHLELAHLKLVASAVWLKVAAQHVAIVGHASNMGGSIRCVQDFTSWTSYLSESEWRDAESCNGAFSCEVLHSTCLKSRNAGRALRCRPPSSSHVYSGSLFWFTDF